MTNRPISNDWKSPSDKFQFSDEIDKRKFFQVGDLVRVVYLNSDHAGKLANVTLVEKEYVWTVNIDNGMEAKWGFIDSLEKVWSVS